MSQTNPTTIFDPLEYLPNELCLLILEYLDPTSLAIVCRINRRWSAFGSLDHLWRTHYSQALWHSAMSRADTNSLRCPEPSWKSAFAARHSLEMRWNAGTYNTFTLKTGFQVTSMRLHGQNLFTGDTTGTILRWNLITRTLIGLPLYAPEKSEVRCLELDPLNPDSILVCGYRNGLLNVWHYTSRRILQCRRAHEKSIETVRLSNRFIVTASMDNNIKVWTHNFCSESHAPSSSAIRTLIQPLELTWTLTGHTALVSALSISANSNTLVSSSPGDKAIKIWDLTTGRCISSHMRPGAVACSHLDGQRLCLSSRMILWDEKRARLLAVLQDPDGVTLAAQGLWRNGELRRMVTVGSSGCVLWEWKEEDKQWRKLYRFVDGKGSREECGEPIEKRILRYCQVDERRVVCCSGPTVNVWDFE